MASLDEIDKQIIKYNKEHPKDPKCVCKHKLSKHPLHGHCDKCNCVMFFDNDAWDNIMQTEEAHERAKNSELKFNCRVG